MPKLQKSETLLLQLLGCAVRGESFSPTEKHAKELWEQVFTLSWQHRVNALAAQALYPGTALAEFPGLWQRFRQAARSTTLGQAARTAEFFELLRELEKRGRKPVILKGLICRSLYPEPEQRPSTDEDLLIVPEELEAYHEALLACGLQLAEGESLSKDADEISYEDRERKLTLELHLRPFPRNAGAYEDCNAVLEGALARSVSTHVYGQPVRTLEPSDHLLYLLCHAYKHILYCGVGVRQICDICLFAQTYADRIDWDRIGRSCHILGISSLAAAMFRIGARHLGIPEPGSFREWEGDELPLLLDCLSGGLYGCEDPDRLHSSNLTLEAVAANKQGRAERGIWSSLFPGKDYLQRRYPYAQKHPWLMPAAWAQRIWAYLLGGKASPARSLQIGRERVELLRQYDLL